MRSKRTCSIPDCEAVHFGLGFCEYHYNHSPERQRYAKKHRRQRTALRYEQRLAALDYDGWRDVPGFEGWLQAHETGLIRSIKELPGQSVGKLCFAATKRDGYTRIRVQIDGCRKEFSVHRLVALAWHGPPPTPEHEVNHKDGVKAHNAASNLEWVTHAENVAHAIATGLREAQPWKRVNH